MYVCSADMSNAFYRMGIPEKLGDLFSLPPVRAKHVPGIKLSDALPDPNQILVPCLCVLPMGWSWSLHLCQKLIEGVVAEELGASRLVSDKGSCVCLCPDLPTFGAVYVDNYAIGGF